MQNTVFIEKSYIVAAILYVKYKYLGEEVATHEEVNYVSAKLQQKFLELNIDAIITNKIDFNYFKVTDVIKVNNDNLLNLDSITNRYRGYISLNILLVIWNDNLILNYLSKINSNKLKYKSRSF